MEDISDVPPTDINPYKVLKIQTNASPNVVKSAYRKLALRHHPGSLILAQRALAIWSWCPGCVLDKVQPDVKDAAHSKFQGIAFAYAILSDERRRKRYDTTGNTTDFLNIEDDFFIWTDFFRAQWAESVTKDRLNNFKSTYQNLDEERRDVLSAYRSFNGKLNLIFQKIMLSNPLDDENCFRQYIDQAIKNGDVEVFDAYVHETKRTRAKRIKRAKKESKDAKKHAKKIGLYNSVFGNAEPENPLKESHISGGEADLAALLQQRVKIRAATFLDHLEAKYAGGGKNTKNETEPSEEAFQQTARGWRREKPQPSPKRMTTAKALIYKTPQPPV